MNKLGKFLAASAAVLGTASNGPIDKNKTEVKIIAKFLLIFSAIPSNVPSPFEQASIAKRGKPTPVIMKPSIPIKYCEPS